MSVIDHDKQSTTDLITNISTVFPLIEAGSQIQAGSLIQAGGQTSFVLIEAGSPIQAGPLIEAGGQNSYIIELGPNCTSPGGTVVHSVIRAYCVIGRILHKWCPF